MNCLFEFHYPINVQNELIIDIEIKQVFSHGAHCFSDSFAKLIAIQVFSFILKQSSLIFKINFTGSVLFQQTIKIATVEKRYLKFIAKITFWVND